MGAKDIRVRVWIRQNETEMQCLEIPQVRSVKPNEGQARADIIQQLTDIRVKRGTPMKLTLIKSEEIDIL